MDLEYGSKLDTSVNEILISFLKCRVILVKHVHQLKIQEVIGELNYHKIINWKFGTCQQYSCLFIKVRLRSKSQETDVGKNEDVGVCHVVS